MSQPKKKGPTLMTTRAYTPLDIEVIAAVEVIAIV